MTRLFGLLYPAILMYSTHQRLEMAGYDKQVEAVAYDNPIPGYKTSNTINLRLWAAKPSGEFDLVCSSPPSS